ncbi:MAG: oligosaccharide flippase family protein [Chloroflexota bacterium]
MIWRRIWEGISAYSGVTLVTTISNLLQAILTLRLLDLDEYGRITLLLSFFATARIFADLGAKSIITSEIAQAHGANDKARVKGLLRIYSRFVFFSLLGAALTFVVIGFIRNEITFFILAAYAILFGINDGLQTVLLSHTEYRRSAGQQIVRSVGRLLLLAILFFIAPPSIFILVLLTHPAKELFTLVFSLRWCRPILSQYQSIKASSVDFWLLFKEQGVFTILTYPIRRVIGELPVWLLSGMIGETVVGIYGAAQKAFALIHALFRNIETVLTPMLPNQLSQNPERVKIAIGQSQKYTFWLSIVTLIFCLPTAPFIISILGGEEYLGVIRPFQWLLFSLLFTPFIQSDRPVLYALRQQKWLFVIRLAKLITFAPTLVFFISQNGALGAIQALLLDGTLHLFVRSAILYRVAPHLWVSPLSIFQIDQFDLQLWARVRRFQFGELFK